MKTIIGNTLGYVLVILALWSGLDAYVYAQLRIGDTQASAHLSETRFYASNTMRATLASDGSTFTIHASQDLPVTFSVTLTAEQVEALKAEFTAKVDLQAKTQKWVNDWLVQFVRKLEETQQRELFEALKSAKPEDGAEVRKRLKIRPEDRVKPGKPGGGPSELMSVPMPEAKSSKLILDSTELVNCADYPRLAICKEKP